MNKEEKTTSGTPVLDALMDEISPLDSRKTEDRMVIAGRIGDLIKEKGWSKSFFAAKIGQQPSVISKWLSGTHNFTLDTLTEISYVLDISLFELLQEKAQSLVFKSSFAVTGIGGLIDQRSHKGILFQEDFTGINVGMGLTGVPDHGSQDWQSAGLAYWKGTLHSNKKKGDHQERNYAIKA